MRTLSLRFIIVFTMLLQLPRTQAGFLDWLVKPATTGTVTTAAVPLTQEEMVRGLREALSKGVGQAVATLGKDGGFLNNAAVKIPMPPQLQTVEKTLRRLGQDKIADEFVATMNHAAEQAVPLAANVFAGAITNMTVTDAKAILTGPDDAATQYFRKTSEARLREKFLPIVRDATAKTGVTAAYKNLIQQAGPMAAFLGADAGDLDGYITQKALDGLFQMIATEEKNIRQNPVARTTDLLKRVFSSSQK